MAFVFLIDLITSLRKKNLHDLLTCVTAVGVASSGGDFMSDLFNKLAMRRKGEVKLQDHHHYHSQMLNTFSPAGISGKGPAGGETGDAPASTGGAFARMSDVIPPLPAPHATTDDDDWEA